MPTSTRPIRLALTALALTLLACQVGPVVSNYDQLEDNGRAEIYAIESGPAGESLVEIALENTTDSAVRISDMEWTILDGEGFTQATIETETDVEIPARAKEKVTFSVATPAHDIVTVRLWGQDLDERPGARPTPVVTR